MSNLDLFNVSKETVVITGASGQLGLVYQKAFLGEGSNVVGIDINKSEEINTLENKFKKNYLFLKGDITSKTSLENCLKEIKQKFETPSVLINNAAFTGSLYCSNGDRQWLFLVLFQEFANNPF